MYKNSDFKVEATSFHFKQDRYDVSKINDIRIKKLSLLDNLGQIIFWVFLFSGGVWLALTQFEGGPLWLQILAGLLTAFGFAVAMFRCARYALQIEFRHIDETGLQWINVARSYSLKDKAIFEEQVARLKAQLA